MSRQTILLYCQHALGLGHFVRALAVAKGLAECYRVVFVNGGVQPDGIPLPNTMEFVHLPPLELDTGGRLHAPGSMATAETLLACRRRRLLELYQATAPAAILVELFPFGRKKFGPELVPLLEAARRRPAQRPLVLSLLRDILMTNRRGQAVHDERASTLANTYFDGIVVHADPRFARLEDSFRPQTRLAVPAHYTGFVLPRPLAPTAAAASGDGPILVSAGGGRYGAPLFRAAVEAHDTLERAKTLGMTLVAGPFCPEPVWEELTRRAAARRGLRVVRSVPDLGRMLRGAAASLSQCGYNTALELLQARVPALVVPFDAAREDEQPRRARLLARHGLVQVMDAGRMRGPVLAEALTSVMRFRPASAGWKMDGVDGTRRLVARLLRERSARRAPHTRLAGG